MTQEELYRRLGSLLVEKDLSGFKSLLLQESKLIRQEDFKSYLALTGGNKTSQTTEAR